MSRTILTALLLAAALTGCGASTATHSASAPAVAHPAHAESTFDPLFTRTFRVAPAAQQTDPAISPSSATTTTVFTLMLTARTSLGPVAGARHAYVIALRGPHPRCSLFTQLTIAQRGARVPVALRPPVDRGWCLGTFAGQVLLQTTPNCTAAPGASTVHCTSFAPRLVQVGRFAFHTR